MLSDAPPIAPPRSPLPLLVKILVSLFVLFHFSAILSHVLSGGGPFVMSKLSSYFRPYLKTMWLDNAYRFYAPDPGPTEVFWYHLQYVDGSTRWTQVPRRESFYFRMPFQRHMSLALLASMMYGQEAVSAKDDASSVASILVTNQPVMRIVLTPLGEVLLRSYARHIARVEKEHPATGTALVSMDCYLVKYDIRSPSDMRKNVDMYDPRMLNAKFIANFSTEGVMANFQQGFKEKSLDDLFIELVQNEILPLLEENNKLPVENRKSIMEVLTDYGIPYPLIQPIAKLSKLDQERFFQKPYDRDTLRERYSRAVKLHDRTMQKLFDTAMGMFSLVPLKVDVNRPMAPVKTKSAPNDPVTDKQRQ